MKAIRRQAEKNSPAQMRKVREYHELSVDELALRLSEYELPGRRRSALIADNVALIEQYERGELDPKDMHLLVFGLYWLAIEFVHSLQAFKVPTGGCSE